MPQEKDEFKENAEKSLTINRKLKNTKSKKQLDKQLSMEKDDEKLSGEDYEEY